MERNVTSPPVSPSQIQECGVQFQLSLLCLMYPGSGASPQALQLERLSEPAVLAPTRS